MVGSQGICYNYRVNSDGKLELLGKAKADGFDTHLTSASLEVKIGYDTK